MLQAAKMLLTAARSYAAEHKCGAARESAVRLTDIGERKQGVADLSEGLLIIFGGAGARLVDRGRIHSGPGPC